MGLVDVGKVETYQIYLDMAFKNGKNAADRTRSVKMPDRRTKSKHIEHVRMKAMSKSIASSMEFLVKKFPHIDHLAPFYKELVRGTIDTGMYKQSLGALGWAKKQVQILFIKHDKEMARSRLMSDINRIRKSFSGRISSVMKQIKDNLNYLDECRKVMRRYPALKTGRPTIVIAGAPNVGKSTILAVLTDSAPETATYPFTTKKLNLGYDPEGNQYVDTPGLLDKPLAERNKIERQAILALKYLASLIVFVIDPTETCGYTILQQRNLLNDIRKSFPQKIILVSNKSDRGATFKNSIEVSATKGTGMPQLKKAISDELSQLATQESPQE